jgi:hypothetical protein
MTDFRSILIGPLGLAVAVLTVLAFIAAMLLHALSGTGQTVLAGDPTAPSRPTHARSPRSMVALRRLAAARWPLAVLTVAVTGYRIYSLS